MKKIATLICVFVIATPGFGQGYVPPAGYVPDSDTAIEIAKAVLIPGYGKKLIKSEEPLVAKLRDEIWTVSGTLHCPDGKGGNTTHCIGGTAVVEISKRDARIVSMMHYK